MAETFGVVAGVITFEYIQLGRHFGADYERCQIKLDIAKTRLRRWGEAININNNPRFTTQEPQDEYSRTVQVTMEEIDALFDELQRASNRYAKRATPEYLRLLQIEDMQPVAQKLHGRLDVIVKRRTKTTNLLKKASWALYDGKNFDKLVGELTEFVDSLEKLCPVETACRDLARMEIRNSTKTSRAWELCKALRRIRILFYLNLLLSN